MFTVVKHSRNTICQHPPQNIISTCSIVTKSNNNIKSIQNEFQSINHNNNNNNNRFISNDTNSTKDVDKTATSNNNIDLEKDETYMQQPNRFTKIYQRMKIICPNDIKQYAMCIENANNNNNKNDNEVQKGICDNEFNKVQMCFQNTRKLILSNQ